MTCHDMSGGCTLRRDHTDFRLFISKLYLVGVHCDAIIQIFDFSYQNYMLYVLCFMFYFLFYVYVSYSMCYVLCFMLYVICYKRQFYLEFQLEEPGQGGEELPDWGLFAT